MPANRKPTAATGRTDAPAAAGEEPTFEHALERLETIVEELEGGALSLEESLSRYEEGMRLSRHLARALDRAEKRIERLVEEEGQGPETRPLENDLGGENREGGDRTAGRAEGEPAEREDSARGKGGDRTAGRSEDELPF